MRARGRGVFPRVGFMVMVPGCLPSGLLVVRWGGGGGALAGTALAGGRDVSVRTSLKFTAVYWVSSKRAAADLRQS